MAKSHCEKCGQNIEFDNSMIGKEVECPSCGSDVILETTQSSSEIEQAENDLLISQIPLRLKELINPAEEILYSSRPSKSSLILKVILSFLSSAILAFPVLQTGSGSIFIITFLLLSAIGAIIVYFNWKNTYYIITDSKTFVMSGVFNVYIKIIRNELIQIISINTGMIDRWLKLNSVQLSTAGQGGGSSGIFAFVPGLTSGSVTLKQVISRDIIKHYK